MYIVKPHPTAIPQVIAQGKKISQAVIKYLASNQITFCLVRSSEHEPIEHATELSVN